jgi:hypothetical protein
MAENRGRLSSPPSLPHFHPRLFSTATFLKQSRLIYNMNSNDVMLIDYVRRMINAGARKIVIPMYLMQHASHEALDEIRRLCKLNGLELEVRG